MNSENNKPNEGDAKLVLLITGDEKSGKKSIINQLKKMPEFKYHSSDDSKSFYTIHYFNLDYKVEDSIVLNLLLEIRILNSKLQNEI